MPTVDASSTVACDLKADEATLKANPLVVFKPEFEKWNLARFHKV
jgi:hypothetical protein